MSFNNGSTGMITDQAAAEARSQFDFAALQNGGEVAEAMKANMALAGDLSISVLERVSLPTGGSTLWNFTILGEEQSEKELIGVPVFFGIRRTIFGSEEPTGAGPVLVSNDTKTMRRISDDIGDLDSEVLEEARIGDRLYDQDKLAYCQWQSTKFGNRRRMKDQRVICLLRENEAWPLLVTVGGMSVQPLSMFMMKLPAAYYQTVVGLGLEKQQNKAGQPYARLKPRLVAKLTKDEGKALYEAYTPAMQKLLGGNSES